MSTSSSSRLYGSIQLRRNRGLAGLYLVVAAFLVIYALLFPGILSIGGFSKFTQNWFPLALVTMAQALLMLNGGITLAIGPLVSLGAVIAATTMEGALGVPGGILAVSLAKPFDRRSHRRHRYLSQASCNHRHAGLAHSSSAGSHSSCCRGRVGSFPIGCRRCWLTTRPSPSCCSS